MDLTRSPTVQVLRVLGVVISAASAVSLGWQIGVGALAVTTLVGVVGFAREHARALNELVLFKPVSVDQVDAIRCGVDKTAPWMLEKSDARDGQHLLSFVSRAGALQISAYFLSSCVKCVHCQPKFSAVSALSCSIFSSAAKRGTPRKTLYSRSHFLHVKTASIISLSSYLLA